MSTALFLPRYFELMRTAADAGLAEFVSDVLSGPPFFLRVFALEGG
jgi:hypothetical protein